MPSRTRAERSMLREKQWKTVFAAKAGLALACCAEGLALASAVGKPVFSSVDDSEGFRRSLEDLECASSILPVRNGTFKTKGIQLCEGSEGYLFFAIFFMMYSFWALAILVDEGFVTILDFIVQELQISEDVAGATFMAAGGSAPEFFTALFSTFEETDTGFGTIVGSAVFNILFVISMSAFFSRPRHEVIRRRELRDRGIAVKEPWVFEPLPLTWWPLLRDSTAYVLGLSMLAIFYFCITPFTSSCPSGQGAIMWYESFILFLLYCGYCSIMVVQDPIKAFVERKFPNIIPKDQRESKDTSEDGQQAQVAVSPSKPSYWDMESMSSNGSDEHEETPEEKRISALRKRASVAFNREDVENKRVSFNAFGRRGLLVNEDIGRPKPPPLLSEDAEKANVEESEKEDAVKETEKVKDDKDQNGDEGNEGEEVIETVEPRMRPLDWRGNPDRANDKCYRVFIATTFVLASPIVAAKSTILFNYDSLTAMEDKVKRRAAGSYAFFMSLVWIAVFTWLMVFSAETMAATIGIPEVILGFTILAAGTSTPDLLSSVFVAQLGYGDMAVSSSIGSNIFDILVGLPIPWLLKIAVTGNPVAVPTGAIGFSLAVIIAMIVSLVGIIIWQEWKLTKLSAWAMLVLYFVFIIAICASEA